MKVTASSALLLLTALASQSSTTFAFTPIRLPIHTTSQCTRTYSTTSSISRYSTKNACDNDSSQDSDHGINNTIDRRDFLTTSTTSVATAATLALSATNANAVSPSFSSSSTLLSSTSKGITFPPMGLGAWAWGDSVFWGYNPQQDADLQQVFNYAVSKNQAFFDTAELYGLGRSESLLGNFRKDLTSPQDQDKVTIATKFAALPFRTKPQNVLKACQSSLKRLNPNVQSSASSEIKPIDLYQIHFPNAWNNEEYWDGLAQCYEQGLVKAVGVSNYGVDALRAVHSKLKERNIPLASNQIQLSLLYRYPIENGLLKACEELNVKVLSYSPLALGFLTGKYDTNNRPSGPRSAIAKTLFDGTSSQGQEDKTLTDLLNTMKTVSANHGNAPLSQVALNWTRSKGTIPIPGARSLKQVTQNLGALEWDLTDQEVKLLDDVSRTVPSYITPDKSPFPMEDINTKLKMFDS